MSACRGCGAEVIFVSSAVSGKAMILDASPKKGVVLLDVDEDEILAVGHRHQPNPLTCAKVLDVYTDHHATCPNVEEFRRPPEGGGRKD